MKRYLFIGAVLLFLFPSIAEAQTDATRQNLTGLLGELSAAHNILISFSPSLTDSVYPDVPHAKGEFKEVLTRILKGTDFVFKNVGDRHYYIIIEDPVKETAERSIPRPPLPRRILSEPVLARALPLQAGIAPVALPEIKLAKRRPPFTPPPVFKSIQYPVLAVKTNLLYDLTATINWGIEAALGKQTSLEISGNYNAWTFSDNRKMKHWLIQPGFRYWMCSRFSGAFWGAHVHYAQYNWGGMLPWGFRSGRMFGSIANRHIRNNRYEGWLAGGGISYGYHWILDKRWSVEAEIGIGYAYLKYDKFRCKKCESKLYSGNDHYFGPTKAAINLVWIIK